MAGQVGYELRGTRNPADADAEIEYYSWHCNRHAFASRLVMAGVGIRILVELMGHSTIQMTMRYAHLALLHSAAADRLVLFQPLPADAVADSDLNEATESDAAKSTSEARSAKILNKHL